MKNHLDCRVFFIISIVTVKKSSGISTIKNKLCLPFKTLKGYSDDKIHSGKCNSDHRVKSQTHKKTTPIIAIANIGPFFAVINSNFYYGAEAR